MRRTDYLAAIIIACAAVMATAVTIDPQFAGSAFGLFLVALVGARAIGEGFDALDALGDA